MKNIAVIGLWYVWLPLAYNFALKWYKVIWFDISSKKLEELKSWIDSTEEIWTKIKDVDILYTNNSEDLKTAEIIIVTVPTPVNENKDPDYIPLIKASESIWKVLKKWQIIVYESTVDPGATEEICLPILEKFSKLKCPQDFKIWYSPERINPGDKEHTVDKIAKVVAWIDDESSNTLVELYSSIISAKIHKAPSIKVAEASKIIENTQRDINIAFMNELSKICDRLWINTFDVLDAASTKWNFLKFTPGLVWWHCIWVDPYYLAKRAQKLWLNPEVILSWRRINDDMPIYVANQIIKLLIKAWHKVEWAKILVLWLTFKENVPDFRNSKIANTIKELKDFWVEIFAVDPHKEYLTSHDIEELNLKQNEIFDSIQKIDYDWIIFAQSHKEFNDFDFKSFMNNNTIFYDIKWKYRNYWFKNYKSL